MTTKTAYKNTDEVVYYPNMHNKKRFVKQTKKNIRYSIIYILFQTLYRVEKDQGLDSDKHELKTGLHKSIQSFFYNLFI